MTPAAMAQPVAQLPPGMQVPQVPPDVPGCTKLPNGRFRRFVVLIGRHFQRNPHAPMRCPKCKKTYTLDSAVCLEPKCAVRTPLGMVPLELEANIESFEARPDGNGGFFPSDPFECDTDLARRWPEKYAAIREEFIQTQVIGLNPETVYAKFTKMKVPALKAYCEAAEIPTDGCKSQEDYINRIKAAFEGQVEAPTTAPTTGEE